MSQRNHTFSIDEKINPLTEKPFGAKYAGTFAVHRPSIADDCKIALNYSAVTAGHKDLNLAVLASSNAVNLMYVFCNMKVLADEKPTWFDENNLFDESDRCAVMAVHEEVERWLESFRSGSDSQGSGSGSGDPAVLVSGEI